MKVYVVRKDGIGVTAFFRDSDDSGYAFSTGPNGEGGFTVKESGIRYISKKTPDDLKSDQGPPQPLRVIDIVTAAALFQGLFLVFMLFRRNTGNRMANRILALFVLNVSIAIFGHGIFIYLFPESSSLTLISYCLNWAARYAAGPLLYFYVRELVRPRFRPVPWHIIHLLPACFAGLYYLLVDLTMSSQQLAILYDFKSTFNFLTGVDIVIGDGSAIQLCLYVVLSLHFLAAHRRRLQDIFSSTEKLNLSWLTFILRFMLGICVLLSTSYVIHSFLLVLNIDIYQPTTEDISEIIFSATIVLAAVLVYAIGYRGLAQPEIFAGIPDDLVEEPAGEQKISISPEKTREIMDRVTKVMDEERPYLDPGLTLPMLADMAGVSRNLLSQAINEHTKQNFYDYVNFYRVETVKEYLKDPGKRDMNVLHIAFDAGFNTKATFNSVFKKSTGLTPSQYRKSFEDSDRGSTPETATLQ